MIKDCKYEIVIKIKNGRRNIAIVAVYVFEKRKPDDSANFYGVLQKFIV